MSKKRSRRDFMDWFQQNAPPFPLREWRALGAHWIRWGRGAIKVPVGAHRVPSDGRRVVVEVWALKPGWGWCLENTRYLYQSEAEARVGEFSPHY